MTKLTQEQKLQIAEAARLYQKGHGISQSILAGTARVSTSYLSHILNNEFVVGESPISDKHFNALAEAVGHQVERNYWPTVPTEQFKEIIAYLDEARNHASTATLLADTGSGKTYTINQYLRKHPSHVYRITVSAIMKLTDFVGALSREMGLDNVGSISERMYRCIDRLKLYHQNGQRPLVIIDEMENASLPLIRTLKGFYDGVQGKCAIALVGTEQYQRKLMKAAGRDRDGIPQFCRRFKAGTRHITPHDCVFQPIYTALNITNEALIRSLKDLCTNYGELNDYLLPVLREADRLQVPVTNTLFRQYHNLPTA